MAGDEEFVEGIKGGLRFQRRNGVDLNPVTGRKDYCFIGYPRSTERFERGRDAGFREGESFHYVRLHDVPGQGPASAGFPGADIDAVGVRPGSLYKIIVPSAVLFAFDDDRLSGEAPAALEQVLDAIRSRSTARVSVEGHTDDVGDTRYNLALSVRRAEAVARYLEGRGVAKARITARGFGATRPLEQNDTEDHRARNRRVEVAIDARQR